MNEMMGLFSVLERFVAAYEKSVEVDARRVAMEEEYLRMDKDAEACRCSGSADDICGVCVSGCGDHPAAVVPEVVEPEPVEEAVESAAEEAPKAPEPPKPYTKEELRAALRDYSLRHGNDQTAAMKVMAEHGNGAEKIAQLIPALYGAVIEALNADLAEAA